MLFINASILCFSVCFRGKTKALFLPLFLLAGLSACNIQEVEEKAMYFKGKEEALEQAINNDDGGAVKLAIQNGANPNAVGLHGVTPIIVTAGNLKFNAMKALIESGANPNAYDKNGDNAVTLATTTYKSDKRYLELLLEHGGDPNSKRPNGDPVITRFGNDHNLKAVRWLVSKGADVNAISKDGHPLVFDYALSIDWDTVWTFMELGADYKFTNPLFTWSESFYKPQKPPPRIPFIRIQRKSLAKTV